MNIRMSTKGKRPLRSLTPSDKIHAIQRIHDGESKASVARDIGVPESTLRGWCKNEDKLRFMSRQSASDKLAADSLSDKMDASSCLMGGPAEKRIKLDPSMPLNFSNKLKYDDMTYKRASLNGLDYGTNKALAELTFNGLPPEYVAFNGAVKNKVFGADISRHGDQAIAAISPLSSLTHLSGLSGLAQSPLAISFNELTSNLNLLAQLNPGLAAMSGLNGLTGTASTLRNVKTKTQSQLHSPRSENGGVDRDRQQGLSVKNWAKQKTVTPTSGEANYGLNLSQNEPKHKIKCPSPSLAPSLGGNMPPLASIPIADDPLLYWLKSQQAMLGLSSLYPPTAVGAASPPPPIRASTPQQAGHHANTPPIAVAPLTPSSTPSGSLDDKNAAWFNWCKAFGASLNSLTPATVAAMHANSLQQPQPPTSTTLDESQKPSQSSPFDNILYSQLTKDAASPSIQSTSSADNASHSNKPNNETKSNGDSAGKPEDLSAKPTSLASPIPTPVQSPTASVTQTPVATPSQSPSARSDSDLPATAPNRGGGSVADCKDVLDSLLYKINNNNNPNTSLHSHMAAVSAEAGSESDGSYHSESNHNHSDSNANNNNNNNSNKTDEEERARCAELNESEDDADAIKHGEKFLKWLENCSNPRVTAVQLMQLRFLISAIKCGNSVNADVSVDDAGECNNAAAANPEAVSTTEDNTLPEESNRNKIRRRK